MLARIRKSAENKDSGFTLIELLVVMIIIGILAAIAIPAFLSQKKKAKATSAKADVTTIGKEITAYYVDGTEALNLSTSTGEWLLTLATGGTEVARGKLSAGNTASEGAAVPITSSSAFCVAVVNSEATDQPWSYVASTGLTKGGCA